MTAASDTAALADLLGAIKRRLAEAEADHRRRLLPPPTRENPRPDPQAMLRAQALEAAGRDLDAIQGQIRTLPPTAAAGLEVAEIDRSIADHTAFLAAFMAAGQPDRLAESSEAIGSAVAFLRDLLLRRRTALDAEGISGRRG